jgi:hypothetical protein
MIVIKNPSEFKEKLEQLFEDAHASGCRDTREDSSCHWMKFECEIENFFEEHGLKDY